MLQLNPTIDVLTPNGDGEAKGAKRHMNFKKEI